MFQCHMVSYPDCKVSCGYQSSEPLYQIVHSTKYYSENRCTLYKLGGDEGLSILLNKYVKVHE